MCDSGVACVDVENRFESALRYDGRVALLSHSDEFSCALELVRGQKSHVKYVIFVFSKSGNPGERTLILSVSIRVTISICVTPTHSRHTVLTLTKN
jgi:hypothetical protein